MIGGEFEIDLSTCRESFVPAPDTYYYASGRSALYQILRSIKSSKHRIWLPDYLCQSIIDAVVKAGWEYVFYELTTDLRATITALDEKGFRDGSVALIINYFGLQNLTDSARIIKQAYPKSIVVEDDVQAFFCFSEEKNPYADYRFTSLRKAFPIPDGGLVSSISPMILASKPNTFTDYKIRAGVMKYSRGKEGIRDEDYLELFCEGERLIEDNYESEMSFKSKSLLSGIDFSRVRALRQANACFLFNCLKEIGIAPVLDVPISSVPLFVPIYLKNRDEVRHRLFQREVYCPIHWPLPSGISLKRGGKMAEHELSLIVDQRYTHSDMEMILELLK